MFTVYEILGSNSNTPLYIPVVGFSSSDEAQQFAVVYAKKCIDNQQTMCHIICEARHMGTHTYTGKRTDIICTRYCPEGHFGGLLLEESC